MSNKLKKLSLIIIIFLLSILLFGQVDVKALTSGQTYNVNLEGTGSPFYITADGQQIFCNQHGASLRNTNYTFTRTGGWLSYQDALAYIFSYYSSGWIDKPHYRTFQRIVWNINEINDKIKREVNSSYEGKDPNVSNETTNDFRDEDWADTVETITFAGLDSEGQLLGNEALEYMKLLKDIENNGGKYKCDLEKITTNPVSVNTDEGTYIIGNFRVNYKTYETNNKKLADITDIYAINTETGGRIENIKLQCAEESGDTVAGVRNGDIYPAGKLPSNGCKFNVILPYNSDAEVKKVQIMVDYKYLGYCEAQFSTWSLNSGKYAWQNQLTFDGGYRQWVTGTATPEENSTWTFELQKVGKIGDNNRTTLPNVEFEITFYDVNGTIKKDTQTYTTNSRGIIEIPGLDFYGDLKIKIKETSTNNGYKLDNIEKYIYVHKDKDVTNKFTDITTRDEENSKGWAIVNGEIPNNTEEKYIKGEVNGEDPLKLTALIENVKEGFSIDIIKVDKYDNDELSGAKFTVKLAKIEGDEEILIYRGEGLKSPRVSITEQDIRNYIEEKEIDYEYDIEGKYKAYITETQQPKNYQNNLVNKEIEVEINVNKKLLSSKYEVEAEVIKIEDRNVQNDYVEIETYGPSEEVSLSIYVKNAPKIPSSSKYYTLNLEKLGVKAENINDTSKYYTLNDIPFTITLYQVGSTTPLQTNTYKSNGGKITLSGLTYTGDILVKIEEHSNDEHSIIGNKVKYIRYKVTKSGRYYYINDYYYADANGNKLAENDELQLNDEGITLNKSGTSTIPVLNMQILNTKDPEIDLTMDIKGTVFLDAITGKAGQVDGLYDGADEPIKGVEVTLCDTNGLKVERTGLTNPVRTNENGQYSFTDLNAMKKYIVKFTYNGQDYEATSYFNNDKGAYDNAVTNGYSNDALWEQYSKAKEDLLHNQPGDITRENLNNRFATISAAPNSYTRADGTNNTAYSDEVMAEVYSDILEAIDQGNNTSEDIRTYLITNKSEKYGAEQEGQNKLNFADDCEIVAYSEAYPAMNKFNISDLDKKLYTVDWETKATKYPADNYPALYDGQNQINFGLKERPNVDLMLSEDVFETKVTVNNQTTTFDYNRKLANGADSEIGLYESDIDYNQEIRSFDITRTTGNPEEDGIARYDTPSDLSIDVFYKVRLYNDSETNAEVTQLVDYYDSDFYNFVAAYLGDENGYDTTKGLIISDEYSGSVKTFTRTGENGREGTTNYKAKTIIIPSENDNIMAPSGSRYVYVHLKTIDAPTSLKLLAESEPETKMLVETRNYVEISQYKTYKAATTDSGTPGLVDIDSIAGNFDINRYDAGNREDDENKAPQLYYKLPEREENSRTLSGNVFEDLRTNLSKDDVNENPLNDGDEIKGIQGITVELIEVVDNVENIRARVTTDENGNYTFKNFIPGKYYVRFTYGDKVYTVGGQSKTLSSQDYQSTYANPYTNTNSDNNKVEYWYAETRADGSVVLDENTQVGISNTTKYSDAYDKVQDREKTITYSETMTNNNVVAMKKYTAATNDAELNAIKDKMTMQAYTSLLELEVEFATEKTLGNQSKEYNIKNVDFGLIKRAESNLELEKTISHIKITQPDNTILLDANVGMRENILGAKALVLLYNGEVIQNDRVNFQYIPTPNAYGTGAIRLEIDDEILHGNNIEITYTLTVKNTTPKQTTLTWFKDGDTNRAIGYYEEQTKDLVYFEDEGIVYHKDDKTITNNTSITRVDPEIVTTKANQVVDYVSNNMQFDSVQNGTMWKLAEKIEVNGYLAENVKDKVAQHNNILLASGTNPLLQDYLKPGDHREVELVLSTTNTQDVDLDFTNIAEILELSNKAGRVDAVSTPGNLDPVNAKVVDFKRNNEGEITYTNNDTTQVINRTEVILDTNPNTGEANEEYFTTTTERSVYEPDSAKAETVTITAPTGDTHYYYVLIGGMLAIFALGIVGIKRFVLNKKI